MSSLRFGLGVGACSLGAEAKHDCLGLRGAETLATEEVMNRLGEAPIMPNVGDLARLPGDFRVTIMACKHLFQGEVLAVQSGLESAREVGIGFRIGFGIGFRIGFRIGLRETG